MNASFWNTKFKEISNNMEIIIRKQWRQLSQSFLEFSAKVNWIVFGLIIVFAPSSWLNVNGNYNRIADSIWKYMESKMFFAFYTKVFYRKFQIWSTICQRNGGCHRTSRSLHRSRSSFRFCICLPDGSVQSSWRIKNLFTFCLLSMRSHVTCSPISGIKPST